MIGAPVKQLTGPEKLIQQADMAMYKAKQQGRDTYVVYSEDLDSKLSKRVELRNELQEAIKTGQIAHLGKWVTTQACKDARRLLEMGLLKGRMAVNLSPLQFHRPGFLTVLRSILEDTGLAPEHLELELTEGILMKDSEGAIDILNALNDMGVATAIDDFGTGFSSFSYLKDLPVDNIKIDRSFVDNVTTNEKDAAVCKGVITLAREMGLNVVAEGVETQEQFCYLKSHGCESFQGYYFARPMLFEDLVQWIGKAG
ncbi:putative bifunctional diguanylate cyclase/phosphodiesterase [Marinobacter sp. UBA3607]|uniref:putative bifunctional diguanylate cyclase/phosphodiesterase n=1 Tax=Marinobacter sp. UBA3607 TaxID=1946820 RepID=UPI0025795475|nr:GGDEF domain-containing phosphodiesterase [Marinobacter sp. UBA3607]